MPTFRIPIDDHEIEVRASIWNGSETVSFDGVVVSRKKSWQYFTAHGFEVVEKSGERVVFEVDILSGFQLGFALRRNGILVAASPRNQIQEKTFGPQEGEASWSRVAPER